MTVCWVTRYSNPKCKVNVTGGVGAVVEPTALRGHTVEL